VSLAASLLSWMQNTMQWFRSNVKKNKVEGYLNGATTVFSTPVFFRRIPGPAK
jgi:hypothetical protein